MRARIFHAIQYLLGNQTLDKLQDFRAFGGVQSYPSRTKDTADVDFSTGSVGLGVAMTAFASLIQDYVRAKGMGGDWPEGRMVAVVGDAELDEGNIYECLLEVLEERPAQSAGGSSTTTGRASMRSSSDRLFNKVVGLFETMGWNVVTLKYGHALEAAFAEPGGARPQGLDRLLPERRSIRRLTFQGGAAWRGQYLEADLSDAPDTLAAGSRDMTTMILPSS